MIRLIATDLDGTLLRRDGSISARTRQALGAAGQAGMVVVFVTARPPRDVHAIAEALGVTGLAICSNGAILYDLAAEAVMRQERLDPDLARRLTEELRAADADFHFATEHGHKVGYEPGFPTHYLADAVHHHEPEVKHVHGLCEEELIKLLVHHPVHRHDDLAHAVEAVVAHRAAVIHSGAPFVEISPPGISKASGLEHLGELLGIGVHEMIAFGDMPNDLPMLALAGRGVAVANAHPRVLAAAREVARSHEDDGVARVIEDLLNGR